MISHIFAIISPILVTIGTTIFNIGCITFVLIHDAIDNNVFKNACIAFFIGCIIFVSINVTILNNTVFTLSISSYIIYYLIYEILYIIYKIINTILLLD